MGEILSCRFIKSDSHLWGDCRLISMENTSLSNLRQGLDMLLKDLHHVHKSTCCKRQYDCLVLNMLMPNANEQENIVEKFLSLAIKFFQHSHIFLKQNIQSPKHLKQSHHW